MAQPPATIPEMWHPSDTQELYPLPTLDFPSEPAVLPKQAPPFGSNNYHCRVAACGRTFPTYIAAYYHLYRHARNPRAVECPAKDCKFASDEFETLEMHWNVLHDTNYLVYSCIVPGCSFTHEHHQPVVDHLVSAHGIDEQERSAIVVRRIVNCREWFGGFFYPRRKGTAQRSGQNYTTTWLEHDMRTREVQEQNRIGMADHQAAVVYNVVINSCPPLGGTVAAASTHMVPIQPPVPIPLVFQRRIGVLQKYLCASPSASFSNRQRSDGHDSNTAPTQRSSSIRHPTDFVDLTQSPPPPLRKRARRPAPAGLRRTNFPTTDEAVGANAVTVQPVFHHHTPPAHSGLASGGALPAFLPPQTQLDLTGTAEDPIVVSRDDDEAESMREEERGDHQKLAKHDVLTAVGSDSVASETTGMRPFDREIIASLVAEGFSEAEARIKAFEGQYGGPPANALSEPTGRSKSQIVVSGDGDEAAGAGMFAIVSGNVATARAMQQSRLERPAIAQALAKDNPSTATHSGSVGPEVMETATSSRTPSRDRPSARAGARSKADPSGRPNRDSRGPPIGIFKIPTARDFENHGRGPRDVSAATSQHLTNEQTYTIAEVSSVAPEVIGMPREAQAPTMEDDAAPARQQQQITTSYVWDLPTKEIIARNHKTWLTATEENLYNIRTAIYLLHEWNKLNNPKLWYCLTKMVPRDSECAKNPWVVKYAEQLKQWYAKHAEIFTEAKAGGFVRLSLRQYIGHYPLNIGEDVDLWQWLYYCTRPEMMRIVTGHSFVNWKSVMVERKVVCVRGVMSGGKGFEKQHAGKQGM